MIDPIPELLRDIDVVSLDVFDTCLHRTHFRPVDVFCTVTSLVDDDVRSLLPPDWSRPDEYRAARIEAERRARVEVGGEVTLDDILDALVEPLGEEQRTALRVALAAAEIEAERRVIRPNIWMREFATTAATSRRVVYLSDMYLPSDAIDELLRTAGFPTAPVLVSCEHGGSKADGRLYDTMLQIMNTTPSRCLHVGDNPGADVRAARKRGLRTLHIANPQSISHHRFERFRVPARLSDNDSRLLGTCLLTLSDEGPRGSIARQIGAGVLAPAIVRWADWLTESLGDTTEPVLLSSRDCGLVQFALNTLQPTTPAPLTYFHVSRRSIGVAALAGGLTPTGKELLLGGRQRLSARELLHSTGLADPELIDLYERRHGSVDVGLAFGQDREPLWELIVDREDIVVSRARTELDAFSRYWQNLGMAGQHRVRLVDVGWRATVQRSLECCLALLGETTVVDGYYLALLDHARVSGTASGMLVNGDPAAPLRFTLEAGIPIIEALLQDDMGSVVGYSDGAPVLGPAPSGRAVVDPIQSAARAAIVASSQSPRPLTNAVVNPLLRLVAQPRHIEAAHLGRFEHSDNVGTESEVHPILPSSLRALDFLRPGFSRTLKSSEWRPGLVALAFPRASTRLLGSYAAEFTKRAAFVVRSRSTVRRTTASG